jgi:hypothetical protein
MLDILDEDAVIMMSDEAHFLLDGTVNKQYTGTGHRRAHNSYIKNLSTALRSQYGAVLPNLGCRSLFFEEDNTSVIVTSARYIEMLNAFLLRELRRRNVNMQKIWFQQDSATAHTARPSMEVVRDMFPQHVISGSGDIHWSPRSPDLSISDYFFLGLPQIKGVHKQTSQHPGTERVHLEITNLEEEMLGRAMENFKERLQECIQKDGHHLTDVIFRR